jgi:protocatechuate 3,4-dioxygenase, beta subunit
MDHNFGRRQVMGGLVGFAGASALPQVAISQGIPRQTPSVLMGPFYPVRRDAESDLDMTRLGRRPARAQGQIVELTGRVLNSRGQPVDGATIELWQANHHGRYNHAADTNLAPLDPNFQGFARLKTRADGSYRLITVKPGAYPVSENWSRPPHIHLDVTGKDTRMGTQMFFPGEALNDVDGVYKEYSEQGRADLTAKTMGAGADGMVRLSWDIVLGLG